MSHSYLFLNFSHLFQSPAARNPKRNLLNPPSINNITSCSGYDLECGLESEAILKETVDAVVNLGLRDLGYRYVTYAAVGVAASEGERERLWPSGASEIADTRRQRDEKEETQRQCGTERQQRRKETDGVARRGRETKSDKRRQRVTKAIDLPLLLETPLKPAFQTKQLL